MNRNYPAMFAIVLTAGLASAQSPPDRFTLAPQYLVDRAPAPPTDAGAAASDAELAKKLANPVASLISVPFQFNYDEGFGPKDAYKLTLNVQPVIPVSLNDDWNLIIRTIVPVVYQDSLADGIDSRFGLGDTLQSFFFSPKAPTSGGCGLLPEI